MFILKKIIFVASFFLCIPFVRAELLSPNFCQVLHFLLPDGRNIFLFPVIPGQVWLFHKYIDNLFCDIDPDLVVGSTLKVLEHHNLSEGRLISSATLNSRSVFFLNVSCDEYLVHYANRFFINLMKSKGLLPTRENLIAERKEVKRGLKAFFKLFLDGDLANSDEELILSFFDLDLNSPSNLILIENFLDVLKRTKKRKADTRNEYQHGLVILPFHQTASLLEWMKKNPQDFFLIARRFYPFQEQTRVSDLGISITWLYDKLLGSYKGI
jgi:hypothetical protein